MARSIVSGRINLRRRQHLALDRVGGNQVLRVERGCLLLQAPAADHHSRVALVLFAGDVMSSAAAPPIGGIGLTAATPATLQRLEAGQDGSSGVDAGQLANIYAKLTARVSLHAIALSELSAEQRLATLLFEMTQRFGKLTPAGCAFELPLTRSDIARYLALNPDTMSRLMSRFRADSVIVSPTKGWATAPQVERLAAMTPLADAIRRLWPSTQSQSIIGADAHT